LLAELFFAGHAGFAFATGIDETTDTDSVTDLPFLNLMAGLHYRADDLVAGHHREDRCAPLAAGLMNVGVADAAVFDVDQHVVLARLAAGEGVRG